jgi:hypothetical protein
MDYYQYFSQYFFTDWIMFVVLIIAFIISLKYHKRSKELRIITYYLGASVLEDSINTYFDLVKKNTLVLYTTLGLFLIVEFIIFCIYLYNAISSRRMRAIMKFFYWTFLALLLFSWIKWKSIDVPQLAYVVEALYLIVPCLVYFYELFTGSKLVFLKSHPSFWIVTGILFYNSCSLPLFLLIEYFNRKAPTYANILFSLNYILYSILYLLFLRAYLCKTKAPSL